MVYGPGDSRHRFRGYLQRMDDHRPAIVLEASMAKWQGSYGYVENVASAIALTLTDERATGRIYNLSGPESSSEADLIVSLGQQAGWQGQVVSLPAAQMPTDWRSQLNTEQHWTTDSTRIRQELGFAEKIDKEDALRRTIAWARTSPPANFTHNPTLLTYAAEDNLLTALSG